MAKTPRMGQIEAMLADDPDDHELRYFLAMEHASAGDDATCVAVLREVIARSAAKPYVPAFLQAGQALVRLDKTDEACAVLRQGIDAAAKAGDAHALSEMQGLLASIE
jgi:thioredoxin-like negative regulator of GroEL